MLKDRQFSLGYLLLEIFWIAAALGSFRAIAAVPEEYSDAGALLLLMGVVATGAALGGAFRRMTTGVVVAVILVALALVVGLFFGVVMVA